MKIKRLIHLQIAAHIKNNQNPAGWETVLAMYEEFRLEEFPLAEDYSSYTEDEIVARLLNETHINSNEASIYRVLLRNRGVRVEYEILLAAYAPDGGQGATVHNLNERVRRIRRATETNPELFGVIPNSKNGGYILVFE